MLGLVLFFISAAESYTVVGLMSGTSMDGINAAVIQTDGRTCIKEIGDIDVPYHHHVRYVLKVAEKIARQREGVLEGIDSVNFEEVLGQYLLEDIRVVGDNIRRTIDAIKKHLWPGQESAITFSQVVILSTDLHNKAVMKVLEHCHLNPRDIRVIGYHGQTLYHNPKQGITIQVGDGQRLASSTGIPVVNDFRKKDVLLGGQGAPFVPLYHLALAVRDRKIPLAVVNCGGISNVTVIRDSYPESVIGFDPGPGNSLIDRFVQLRTKGELSMDVNGRFGSQGRVNGAVITALMQKAVWKDKKNYLLKPPPKSLDVGDLHLVSELDVLSLEDGCATLEYFTALTIVDAVLKYVKKPQPRHWVLAGGGWYNPEIKRYLINLLKTRLSVDVIVQTADEAGWNSRAMEAQIFAYLAVRYLNGLSMSYPNTTGVPKPVVGGQYFEPGLINE